MRTQRMRLGVLAVLALAVAPLAVAATAFACARLATLKLDRVNAGTGTEVNVTGRNFNGNAAASNVAVRFNSRTGKVLWEGRADAAGKFKGTFTVPEAASGYYVIMATQTAPNGATAAGTPGRASLRVRGTSTRSGSSLPGAIAAPGGGGSSATPSAPAIAGVTLLLLGLTGGGLWVATAARRSRASVVGHTS